MSDDNIKTFMVFSKYHANILKLISEAGLEFNESTVKEIIGGLKVNGIGVKKIQQMKEDFDVYMASVDTYKPSINAKDRIQIQNPTIFAESFSVGGEVLYQAQTAATRFYGTTQSLVFGDKITVQNPNLYNLLGYSVLNKHNRFQEVEIEEGTRLRDYVVEVISNSNGEFDSSELKATLLDYAKINPGIDPYATLSQDTVVKLPPHGKVASTVFNVGASQDFLRSNLSIVRGQAYSSFIASAVSKELINDVIQRFGAKVYYLTAKELEAYELALQGKTTFEYLCKIDDNVNAYLEWADGKHFVSKGMFKALKALLVQGRTYTFANANVIKKIQSKVNKLGARLNAYRKLFNKFFGKIKASGWKKAFAFLTTKEFLGEKGRKSRLTVKLYNQTKAIAIARKLNASPTDEVLNEARLDILGYMVSLLHNEVKKSKSSSSFDVDTFSKGLYQFPHKNYISDTHTDDMIVWLHPTDIKTRNKKAIKNLFIEEVKKAFKPGMLNQRDGIFIEIEAGKTSFSLMDVPKVRKTSFGHQYSMWFKSWDSMTLEQQKNSHFKSAKDQMKGVQQLLDYTMEYHGINDWVEFAKKKALGPKENKASYDALNELGKDWFLTPKGNETLKNTLEGCLTSFFKGAYYEPQDSVFIAPNPFRALQMVEDDVEAIIPWPEHLTDSKGNPLVAFDVSVEAIIGRYPSNNSENPVMCKVTFHRKPFSIYSKKGLIDPIVADIDGDRGSEIVYFPIQLLVEALDDALNAGDEKRVKMLKLAIGKQKIWNMIILLCEFKTIDQKFYIEDLCPIDVEKTSSTMDWWNDSDEQISKMMGYFTWPNQAPVGPPANHVQTASLNGLMSVAFSCKSGTTLQNYIDSQKSLNDYPWLNWDTIVDEEGRHSLPPVKDWKRLNLQEVQSILLETPNYWTEEDSDGEKGDFWCLHPEILLPVNIKVWLQELVRVSSGDYVAKTFEGKLYGEDEIEISKELIVHKDWINFIKSNDACLPNIRSLTHYFNFSLEFPDGYSQRKTPWHADSRGDYVFSWLDPKEYPLHEEYCDAGSNSILGLQFDSLVERAVFDLPEVSESIFAGYEAKVSKELNDFLKTFNSHKVNAYTAAAIPEAISKEVVSAFGKVLPYIRIEFINNKKQKVKGFWLQNKLGLGSNTYVKLVQEGAFDKEFWESEILPFGFKYASLKGERPFGDYCSTFVRDILLRIKTGDVEAAKLRQTVNLKEADRWIGIKRSAQTLFEFFATQSFGGCSIWSEVKKDIKKNKTGVDDWAKVQVQLELKHNHALHGCKSCQRQFLSWATKGTTSTADWQFCQTVEFINAVDKNLWAMSAENFQTKGLKDLFEVKSEKGFDLDLDIDKAVVDLRDGNEIDFALFHSDPEEDEWFEDDDSEDSSEDNEWFSSKDPNSGNDTDSDSDDDDDEEESSEETTWTKN